MAAHACDQCLGSEELAATLARPSPPVTCDFCGAGVGFDLAEVAVVAAKAIRSVYYCYSPWNYGDHLDLGDLLRGEGIGDSVVDALVAELMEQDPAELKGGEEAFFHRTERAYAVKPPEEGSSRVPWAQLHMTLRGNGRFFNDEARELMERLFGPPRGPRPFGLEVLVVPSGEREIFRVRRAPTWAEMRRICSAPGRELGAPQEGLQAGRMNPCGVRVFYGSFSRESALAEVRPYVGELAVIGRFRVVRNLVLLNLPACGRAHRVSCFDPAYVEKTERIEFYGELDAILSRPVLPDEAPLEYIASQAVAEYVKKMGMDGIVYSSSQIGRPWRAMSSIGEQVKVANVVLFEPAPRDGDDRDPFESVLRFQDAQGKSVKGIDVSVLDVVEDEPGERAG